MQQGTPPELSDAIADSRADGDGWSSHPSEGGGGTYGAGMSFAVRDCESADDEAYQDVRTR